MRIDINHAILTLAFVCWSNNYYES